MVNKTDSETIASEVKNTLPYLLKNSLFILITIVYSARSFEVSEEQLREVVSSPLVIAASVVYYLGITYDLSEVCDITLGYAIDILKGSLNSFSGQSQFEHTKSPFWQGKQNGDLIDSNNFDKEWGMVVYTGLAQ